MGGIFTKIPLPEKSVRIVESSKLGVLHTDGVGYVSIPGEGSAPPLNQVIDQHLDVPPAGGAADVRVTAGVLQGPLVSPSENYTKYI